MEEEKFAINVEWYDEISSLVHPFILFYYSSDRTVEMVIGINYRLNKAKY